MKRSNILILGTKIKKAGESFYAVKFHANGFIEFYHFLVIILEF